jgi:hypothetical protein
MEKKEKLNLNQEIKSFDGSIYSDGKPYNDILELIQKGADLASVFKFCQNKSAETPLTIKRAILYALDNFEITDKKAGSKFEVFKIAQKIEGDLWPQLTVENWTLIKSSVESVYRPSIVGFIWNAIESR